MKGGDLSIHITAYVRGVIQALAFIKSAFQILAGAVAPEGVMLYTERC
ncbi:hypothetical protein [Anaerobacterium chartisolvens]|nr:hypothetical protein [Anaerobacterium chartisolvens]